MATVLTAFFFVLIIATTGIENFDKSDGYGGDNERWRTNTGINGAIVNGNNVIAMGLFVEHFQQHNLIWGEWLCLHVSE